MLCPRCQTNLKKQVFYNTEIDYCPRCLGLWFNKDELREAKDEKDRNLNWLDFDLWKDEKHFKVAKSRNICPVCSVPLYEVNYGDSDIKVDLCSICQGVFLDRGEFKKVIDYLKEKEKYEILNNYFKNLIQEGTEVFTGPETFKEELGDFLTVLKLLNYKLLTQHPAIIGIISSLPK